MCVGIHKGTCVLIEKALNRKLVWLPCRHHIMEIILRGVFEVFWNTTSGPNVPIFDRFKKSWDKLDQSKYKSGMDDEAISNILTSERAEIVTFINNCLQVKIFCYYYHTWEFFITIKLSLPLVDTNNNVKKLITI